MTGPLVTCPGCGGPTTKKFLRHGPPELVRCDCGLVFLVRRRSEAEVAAYFRDKYISEPRKLTREYGIWRDAALNQEARLVCARKNGGRILDVGCAGGAFLERFPTSEWERHGVEPSLLAAEEARRRGIRIYNSTLQEARIPYVF